jgi:hypothetical protein
MRLEVTIKYPVCIPPKSCFTTVQYAGLLIDREKQKIVTNLVEAIPE